MNIDAVIHELLGFSFGVIIGAVIAAVLHDRVVEDMRKEQQELENKDEKDN